MRLDSLSSRIFATLAVILVLLLTAAAVFGEVRIRAFHRGEIEARLRTAADLLGESAADLVAGRRTPESVVTRLQELGRATRLRLTVIGTDGIVLADSEASLPLANHADRPEILRASETGEGLGTRRSATTGKDTYYLARRVQDQGRTIGFVRAAAELEEMERAIGALRRSLLVGALLALGAGLALSAFLARWIARPLEVMGESAMDVTSGSLDSRIRDHGPREVRLLASALNSMADRLRQQIGSERRARAETETVLSSMAEGVIAFDAHERVLLMNGAAARMLGLAAPLDPGALLWQRLRFPNLERGLREVLGGGETFHVDADSPRDDGRTLTLSVAPLRGEGVVAGAVALLSDVTEVRRLEQVRIDFVANVSHELRTPLAAIRGALETLSDPVQDEETRVRFLDLAHRNAARLQAIVADLLDLSSIEAQGDSMPLEPISLHDPLRSAGAALSGAAQQRKVELKLPDPPRPELIVAGDAKRLEQAFTNLIVNAIQYTPAGGRVVVRVRTTPEEVLVEVEDTGIGIPAAALPRVFERFYRVDRGRSRDTGGTGLGLAIVKHIVLAHDGQVDVRSEEGRGSTFTIRLPRR